MLQLNFNSGDILTCVLEPIRTMLTTHDSAFEVLVECPQDLIVQTDVLGVKQVVLNLAITTKLVQKGFIRLRAEIVEKHLRVSIQDSGPGIPMEKREEVFKRFQTSLDVLSQGTRLGLSLCYSLAETMGGKLSTDDSYDSRIEGFPGVRFVLQLDAPIETTRYFQEDNSPTCAELTSGRYELKLVEKETSPALLPEAYSILFVDDDHMLRKLFIRAVTKVAPSWSIKESKLPTERPLFG
jgi:hypothetical protein